MYCSPNNYYQAIFWLIPCFFVRKVDCIRIRWTSTLNYCSGLLLTTWALFVFYGRTRLVRQTSRGIPRCFLNVGIPYITRRSSTSSAAGFRLCVGIVLIYWRVDSRLAAAGAISDIPTNLTCRKSNYAPLVLAKSIWRTGIIRSRGW